MAEHSEYDAFEADARKLGFDEVLVREWQPLTVVDLHTHPFDARARVVGGEMWLTVAGQTRHLRSGDTFELDAEVPHSERYGPEGATYWVARRGKAAPQG
ncbi:MAG: AraC family transcriptional regulator [Methylibium sp. NZG]|nr:MAG: AraC family transcriptional regulator [Methylibium sp. NZG]